MATATSRAAWRRRLAAGVVALSVAFPLTGCGLDDTVNRAVSAIDQAIDDITVQSQDWQVTLNHMTDDLPREARELIRNDLVQLAEKAVGAATTGVQCIVDMLGKRVVEGLRALRAQLLDETYDAPPPSVCLFTPSEVNLGAAAEVWQTISIYGYDMDSPKTLHASVRTKSGTTTDISGKLRQQTKYLSVLDLQDVQFPSDADLLTISGANDGLGQLPVLQPVPPKCRTEERHAAPVDRQVSASLVRGDAEFFGNGPLTTVSFAVTNTGAALQATLSISAQEQVPALYAPPGTWWNGDTYAEGSSTWPLWEAPDGWQIISYTPAAPVESYVARDTSTGIDFRPASGGSIVKAWAVVGDTPGVDVGVAGGTSVTASLTTLNVVIAQVPGVSGCAA
ncbi:hypothetical protein [Phycicoccus avicenniae]|uniref:hypothetical protein n=1 Tax=Phycicoccus avicenniae TaxID=2828860 RepID=UPI003D2D2E46